MIWPFNKKNKNISERQEALFIISVSTPNFAEMINFFRILELTVRIDKGNQCCPSFNNQRCASVWQSNNLIMNLEENTSLSPSGCFNLLLEGEPYTEKMLRNICNQLEYSERHESMYDDSYVFKTPDGGSVSIGVYSGEHKGQRT